MKRILFYSPYGSLEFHTVCELTIAHALKLRGAEVSFLTCDASFSDCDLKGAREPAGFCQSCTQCMAATTKTFKQLTMPHRRLNSLLSAELRTAARAWVDDVPSAELAEASYKNYPLGTWVKPRLEAFSEIEPGAAYEKRVRSILFSAALGVEALSRALDEQKPDLVSLLDGPYFSHRLCFELARARGIDVIAHSRADGLLQFQRNNYGREESAPESIALPLLTAVGKNGVKTNFSSTDELLPGKDSSLDAICNAYLEGLPIVDAAAVAGNSDSKNEQLLQSDSREGLSVVLFAPRELEQLQRSLKRLLPQVGSEASLLIIGDEMFEYKNVFSDESLPTPSEANVHFMPADTSLASIMERVGGDSVVVYDQHLLFEPHYTTHALAILSENKESAAVLSQLQRVRESSVAKKMTEIVTEPQQWRFVAPRGVVYRASAFQGALLPQDARLSFKNADAFSDWLWMFACENNFKAIQLDEAFVTERR